MARPIRRLAAAALAVALTAGGWTPAFAQDSEEAEKGRFTRFVEDTISTPTRRISIGSIDGVLSSDVRISEITVSDPEGVWLRIEGAHLVWSRLALLRGRLDIDLLEAERIAVLRTPIEDTTPDPAASPGFALPELPVEIAIDRIAVPTVEIAEAVFGDETELAVEGAVSLVDRALDADLSIRRTDEKPGAFTLSAAYADATGVLDLSLLLEEPADGVLGNLLNIPDRPAIRFEIAGEGPLDAFAADIALAAAGQDLVAGRATISSEDAGAYRFRTDVTGNLAPLVPAEYAPYVQGESRLTADAALAADGSVTLDAFEISSGVLDLVAEATLAPDGFPTAIAARGTLGVDDGSPTPLPGGAGTVNAARFELSFGGADDAWSARFDLSDLATGAIRAGEATIVAGGAATNLQDPVTREVDFEVTGTLSNLSADDPDLATALGDRFDLLIRGAWDAGQPVVVEIAEIKNPNAAVHFAGQIDGLTTEGRYWLNAADVAPFAGLAGQPDLSGALTLDSTGTVSLGTGAFTLSIESEAVGVQTGIPAADALLAGTTTLSGGIFRTTEGLRFDGLTVANPQITARLDGGYDLAAANLDVTATIADVATLTDRASGTVSLTARIEGTGTSPAITAEVTAPTLALQDRRLTDGRLGFAGRIDGTAVDGTVQISGNLDGVVLDGRAGIDTLDDGTRRIEDLLFTAGGTRVEGTVSVLPSGLAEGRIAVASPDVAAVAPLLLLDASGALEGTVALSVVDGEQAAAVNATVRNLQVETVRVGAADVEARAADLFGVPSVEGRVEASEVAVGEIEIDRVIATAETDGTATDFTVDADLEAGSLAAAGSLAEVEGGFDVTLARLDLIRAPDLSATLAGPASVRVRGSAIAVSDAVLTVGAGRIAVSGEIADRLNLTATVENLPLSIAEAVAPDLAIGGTVSGRVNATGAREAPVVAFDVAGRGLTARPLRDLGIDPLDVTATGRYADGTARIDAATTVAGGRITVQGTVGDRIDLAIRAADLPASLANAASPGLGAEGRITATATVGGTPADPSVAFEVAGTGLSVGQTRAVGIPALDVRADGTFVGETVTLSRATASGGGISLTASGRIPISGGGLAVDVSGDVPLSLADRNLATRGARLAGTARIDATVTGSLADPQPTGRITVGGATFTDPETATRLTAVDLVVDLQGQRAVIERFSAVPNGRGTVTASGSIGLAPGSGFPVDVVLAFRNARFSDGRIVTADASGDLAVRGPATGGLTVTGTVSIARAEITVPESLPGGVTLLDVDHRLPPPNVRRTLERARLTADAAVAGGGAGAGGLVLDVTIDAPARIFVRGRGIDAELGGRVTIRGPISDIRPVGSFELIRGRVVVIGQRIDLDRGSVTLQGDLDPYIDFVATTRSEQITVTASVTGFASDPTIVLSSDPDLPQDEILARFLFGRSLTDLSPLQIANLAAAAAQLGGSGGEGLLGSIREATGLDDLDIVTDSEGNAGVRVGRYIGENVYLGVTAGTRSSVSVNLDITEDLKARAEVGTEGDGRFGIFYEKEY